MSTIVRASIAALVLAVFCPLGAAAPVRHGFADAQFARDYAPAWPQAYFTLAGIQACKVAKRPDGEQDFTFARARYLCPGAQLSIGDASEPSPDKAPLVLQIGKRRLSLPGVPEFKADGLPFLDSVHKVDLNQDGNPDFVLEFSYHGNGLAAIRRVLGFVLSEGDNYRLFVVRDVLAPGPGQLVQERAGGKVLFMIGRLESDVSSRPLDASDGKPHTFFVFDALEFPRTDSAGASAQVVLASKRVAGLPAYVLFTRYPIADPGRRATKLLSAAQQELHWANPVTGIKGSLLR